MYIVKTPKLVKRLFPDYVWEIPTREPVLYLTFDDGPVNEATPLVLDILKDFDVKATFFCVGDNIKKHASIFERILKEGHTIGNHTFHHLNGKKVSTDEYVADVAKCAAFANTKLFRPPYGRITREQANVLMAQGYKIIMWDILCGDFDRKVTAEKCSDRITNHAKSGSIIVLHDSKKTKECVKKALPKTLKSLLTKGFRFESLTPALLTDEKSS